MNICPHTTASVTFTLIKETSLCNNRRPLHKTIAKQNAELWPLAPVNTSTKLNTENTMDMPARQRKVHKASNLHKELQASEER